MDFKRSDWQRSRTFGNFEKYMHKVFGWAYCYLGLLYVTETKQQSIRTKYRKFSNASQAQWLYV